MLELSAFEFAESTVKLRRHKSPGNDQIPAKLIYAVGRTICSEIHKLINFVWNKEELPEEWKGSIIVPVHKKGDKTRCSNYRGISVFSNYLQNFIQHPAVNVSSICRGNYWGSSVWILMQQVNY